MGNVLRIEKTSIHDGEGLRTVVFLKGCPLRCKWCAAPESQTPAVENGYGMEMSVDEVAAEITKDEIFFFHSQGGVTISGGEPLMQPDFCKAILRECSYRGIHTAMESSFYGAFENIARLLPYLGDIYVDLKLQDAGCHSDYTGVSNEIILDNIEKLQASDFSGNVHIRIPCIPTVNMDVENIVAAAVFCQKLRKLTDVELLPYHRLGVETYRKLNMRYELEQISTPSREELETAANIFHEHLKGKRIKIKGEIVK